MESAGTLKIAIVLYDQAVPGMHRAGPGERGGAPYGRRTVATAERAAIQISEGGKGLKIPYWEFGISEKLYILIAIHAALPLPFLAVRNLRVRISQF